MQFLDNGKAKLWSRFFCLSVYVTMYLNDHQRTAFYESLGLNTKQFNRSASHRASSDWGQYWLVRDARVVVAVLLSMGPALDCQGYTDVGAGVLGPVALEQPHEPTQHGVQLTMNWVYQVCYRSMHTGSGPTCPRSVHCEKLYAAFWAACTAPWVGQS